MFFVKVLVLLVKLMCAMQPISRNARINPNELGRVTRPNLILRSACSSAGLGLVLCPKINCKLRRVC